MARNAPPPPQEGGAGSNFSLTSTELALIEKLTNEVRDLERERTAINESIGERRAAIKAMGIDLDAWRAAKRRKEMDPDDRDNFDRSQAMVNAALGVPIQGDLFAAKDAGKGSLPSSLN